MKTTWLRRLLAALTHTGPGYDTAPLPYRGDRFDHWLRDQREQADSIEGHIIDGLLDTYRLHADTGTPLNEHVCNGRVIGDCDCFEQADRRAS